VTPGDDGEPTVRLLFVGDVMLGRRVAAVVASEPTSVFEGSRFVVSQADIAVGNLESPIGSGAPGVNGDVLVATSDAAALVAGAGFDVMAIANNHAGDAGPSSVTETLAALGEAGVQAVGGGSDLDEALSPLVLEDQGVGIAFLAFDLTGGGPAAGPAAPGIARWSTEAAQAAVAQARTLADVVVVGLHGGVEYGPRPDPALVAIVSAVAGWGVDIVWTQGAHVRYPVETIDPDGDGQPAVVAYGLGNFLFDQRITGTQSGSVLEVIVGRSGALAYRIGGVNHAELRAVFTGWDLPAGDAVLLDGEWWGLVEAPVTQERQAVDPAGLGAVGEVAAAGSGDLDGDGVDVLVVAFRRPYRPTPVTERFGDRAWIDSSGRSAHLGVYDAATGEEVWVAGALPHPIADLAVCGRGVAVAYEELDAPEIVAAAAMTWRHFGFVTAVPLPGAGLPGCADVDRDGSSDPVISRS
jgi:poly-gamma-glutamate synthesis protein (capsule biosynthesis protein)